MDRAMPRFVQLYGIYGTTAYELPNTTSRLHWVIHLTRKPLDIAIVKKDGARDSQNDVSCLHSSQYPCSAVSADVWNRTDCSRCAPLALWRRRFPHDFA
jgi:hypothetical protein